MFFYEVTCPEVSYRLQAEYWVLVLVGVQDGVKLVCRMDLN